MRDLFEQDGSLPLALLASILVAGLIGVLFVRVATGEQTTRFDRGYTETIQVADAGINQVLFRLNEGQLLKSDGTVPAIGETATGSSVVDGIDYQWSATRRTSRAWDVTSSAVADDVDRAITAVIEERPLFYPGAFGDTVIALSGTSTKIDSYNSSSCTTPARKCRWGNTTSDLYEQEYGTGNGSIGTNENLNFSGLPTSNALRPGSAFLFDWEGNPPSGVTASDPYGDRCDGHPCTPDIIRTVPEKVDFSSDAQMDFIASKFEAGGECEGTPTQRAATPERFKDAWQLGVRQNDTFVLSSYATASATSPGTSSVRDPAFTNFYCAESLTFFSHVHLETSVTAENPVVVFVKDFVHAPNSGRTIGCHSADRSTVCSRTGPRNVRPEALRLQVYSAGLASSATASNVTVQSQNMFAGVLYAPRSACYGSGGGVDVYGAVICRSMENVGNWRFHYDDALGTPGTGAFTVAFWREDI